MDSKNIEKIIYKWVADNFGESEAEDPSWNIKVLAEHLAKELSGGTRSPLTTPALTELTDKVDAKLEPIRQCVTAIETGVELDVADHYDCADDLAEIAKMIQEVV